MAFSFFLNLYVRNIEKKILNHLSKMTNFVSNVIFFLISIFRVVLLGPIFLFNNFIGIDSDTLLVWGLAWLVFSGALLSMILRKVSQVLWWWTVRVLFVRFLVKGFLVFYVLFELRLVPILLIIMFYGGQPERLSAGLYFIMYTLMFSLPFITFMVNWPILLYRLGRAYTIRSWLFLLLAAPFLVKMPVIGLHFWLPKAHVEANTTGSIILAGLLLKLGRYGLARITYITITTFLGWRVKMWVLLAILRGGLTVLQSDRKKMVAYRRVSHMTFLRVGLLSNSKLIISVTVLVSLSHGWASITIFAIVGASSKIRSSRLLFLNMRENSFSWILLLIRISLINNASIPPIPSFYPEIFLLLLLINTGNFVVLIFVLLRLFVCYYNTFLFTSLNRLKRVALPLTSFFNEGYLYTIRGVLTFVSIIFLCMI